MSARVNLLSTKRIEPLLVGRAAVHGIRIITREFIRVEHKSNETLAGLVRRSADASCFVFTSINAVEALHKLVNTFNISLPRGMRVFATEGRTASRVRNAFPQFAIAGTAVKASDLAQKIIHAREADPVWFCGNLRRQELKKALDEKNISITEIEVYQTEPTPIVINEKFDGLIFFSPSAVSSFLEKNRIFNSMICFAVGETTAEALKGITQNIKIAPAASQEKMVELIIEHYKVK